MPTLTCPTCGRLLEYAQQAEVPYRPFCSARCQWIDLSAWLDGEYAIGRPVDPSEDQELLDADGACGEHA